MKITKYVLAALPLLVLASCGGSDSSAPASSQEPSVPASSEASSQEPAPTFEAFTLSQLHDARVAGTLAQLDKKYVSIKGKVTYAKRPNDLYDALFIQNGKHAVMVGYSEPYQVNVGDSVEVKGRLSYDMRGEIPSITVSTHPETNPHFAINVINETIPVEAVTITKEADLLEFESSKVVVDFSVTGEQARGRSAFVGKLADKEKSYIVAPLMGLADLPETTFEEGDNVRYEGVFNYHGDSSAWVFRYADAANLKKIA